MRNNFEEDGYPEIWGQSRFVRMFSIRSGVLGQFDNTDENMEDLIPIGTTGLIKANRGASTAQGEKEWTQREIPKELGISRSWASRIEKRAFMKLYHKFYKVKRYTQIK